MCARRSDASGRRRRWAALALLTALSACAPDLDQANPTLPRPASMVAAGDLPVAPSIAARAQALLEDGDKALGRSDLKAALAALTEACHLDPSLGAARLSLARTYLRAGLGSVALDALETLAARGDGCGPCVEAIQAFAADPEFAPLHAHPRGAALVGAAGAPLAWATWATTVAEALTTPKPAVLVTFAHAEVPFTLARSCPDCANPDRRAVEERPLVGASLLAKVASRFDTRNPMLGGIALSVAGAPTCAERCCRWAPAPDVPAGGATLRALCFRPLRRDSAALTRIELEYKASAPR